MGISDLPDFLAAVARRESGANYMFRSEDGQRFGAYGFPVGRWDTLAAAAGVPGADWRDPKAQDRVAVTMAGELYRRMPSWPLVATAWMAGMEAARLAARVGFQSPEFAQLTASGESVLEYVTEVSGQMRAQPRLELPDPAEMVLAPGERPPRERRRSRVHEAGLTLLRSTRRRRPPTEPTVATEVTEAERNRDLQRPEPTIEPTIAAPVEQTPAPPEAPPGTVSYE